MKRTRDAICRRSDCGGRPRNALALGALLSAALSAALCAALPGFSARAEFARPYGVAVIIGNKAYENERVPEVSYAHRDADAFRRFVVDVLGFNPDNIIDIHDASQADMEAAFGNERSHQGRVWRYLHPRHGSDVVVYYSGHGVPGLKDRRGHLLPADADPDSAEINGYPIDVLYANLAKLEDATSVQVFLDACFSGDSDRGMLVRSASPVYVQAALPEASGEAFTVLAAASGKEVASWDDEARHGLFTHHLLDALYGAGDADGEGSVTAAEAKRYLDDTMTLAARREFGRLQNANLNGLAGAVLVNADADGTFRARPALDGEAAEAVAAVEGEAVETAESLPGTDEESPEVAQDESPEELEKALSLTRAQRVLVQRGLAALEYDVGPADGLFGKRTRTAVAAYQKAKGFAETGYLSSEQAEALAAVGEEAAQALAEASRVKSAGDVFRDCPECPELVVVPAGTFRMGSPSNEEGRYDNEGPVHEVRIGRSLAVGVYEVTRGQWSAFVSATGHYTGNWCWTYESGEWEERSGRTWSNPGFSQSDAHPVVCVSWDDARAYVMWLSRKTGETYRLLSESEWEYAARAGTTTPFHFGATISTDQANYDGNYTYGSGRKGKYRERTVPVGSFAANGFALHDMHGNVWEWVQDCWNDGYAGAPRDGGAWERGACSKRVLRGGSWNLYPRFLRSAFRFRYSTRYRYNIIGFRIARMLTPASAEQDGDDQATAASAEPPAEDPTPVSAETGEVS